MNGAELIRPITNHGAAFPNPEYGGQNAAGLGLTGERNLPAGAGEASQAAGLPEAPPAFGGPLDAQGVKELFTQSRLMDGETTNPEKERLDEQLEKLRAIAAIKRKLAEGAGHVSGSAVGELLAGGISLEKMSFHVISDMLVSMDIAENLPANADAREEAARRIDMVSDLSDRDVARLLKSEKPLTYENIYAARFAASRTDGPGAAGRALDETARTALEAETRRVLARDGVAADEETLGVAGLLLEEDVPITGENIEKARFLRDMQNDGGLLESLAGHLQRGGDVWRFTLFEPGREQWASVDAESAQILRESYAALARELPSIQPEKVDVLLRSRIPLTLYNLRSAPDTPNEAGLPAAIGADEPVEGPAEASGDPAGETAEAASGKRLLAEIQFTMTLDAARRLAAKGVNIDTMPLQEALARLKEAEAESRAASLRAMGAEATADNVSAMSGLYRRMAEMNPLTNNVFGGVIRGAAAFTVAGVHEAALYARMREGYEQFATAPDPKYGDSFAKVRGAFGPFLESAGIEPTDANVRAASILSRNGMDVTTEALEQVKLIDAKIDYVQNRLHPAIAATIIKEGANPAHMRIDDLIAAIDTFNDSYGENLKDKIAAHILELDREKNLAPQERAAVLGIYRVLAATQKNGGAPLGIALQKNAPLTLGALLEAAKAYGKIKTEGGSVQFDVDDGFGSLEKLIVPENNVSAAFKTLEEFALDDFAHRAAPETLARFIGETPGYMGTPLAQAAARLRLLGEEPTETVEDEDGDRRMEKNRMEKMEKLESLFQAKATTIRFLEQHGLPATMDNVAAMTALREDPFFFSRALNRLKNTLEAENNEEDADEGRPSVSSLESALALLEEGQTPGEALVALHEKLEALKEAQTSASLPSLIKQFDLIQNAIKVQNYTQGRGGGEQAPSAHVKLPVRLGGGKIASLNMYILNEAFMSESSSRFVLSLDTENCGNVQAVADLAGERVTLTLHTDDPAALNRLREGKDTLLARLAALGFQAEDIRFGVEDVRNTLEEEMLPNVDLSAYAAKYEASV